MPTKTDGKGNVTAYNYDALGRLLKKTYPDGSVEVFEYDKKGNVIYAGNQYIAYSLTYDSNGRITSVTDSNGRVVFYEYDISGNKTKMISPDGRELAYKYESGRLSQMISEAGTFIFAYDTNGRRKTLSYPNGATAFYAYDESGRLTALTHKNSSGAMIDSFTYTHDKVGNRITKAMPDRTTSYKYDEIYQLLEAVSSTPGWSSNGKTKGSTNPLNNQKESYSYDPVGNRLLGPDKNDLYSYNQGNELMSSSDAQYGYDLNGNLIFKADAMGTTAYSYDYENRLIKVSKPDGMVVEFKYGPFGRRIEKSITPSPLAGEGRGEGATTTRYFYDNEDILFEYDSTGTIGNRYIHGPGIDEPIALINKAGNYFYHADGLGSITSLTDAVQKIVQTYEYDSFGKLKDMKNTIKQPYTFTGREFDRETGMYYHRARYRDPELGIFISFDPILHPAHGPPAKTCNTSPAVSSFDSVLISPQQLNPYIYGVDNPVTYTDPYGKAIISYTSPYPLLTPTPQNCGHYRSACDCGSTTACVAYGVCLNTPNSLWANCTRGCLREKYVNRVSDSQWLFVDHPLCFAACAVL